MTLQRTTVNGNLLRLDDGQMANECCCGTGVTTVCSTETCGGTNNPTIILTVFDADYAGGNINWCGLTWTQSEVQAGTPKCACPTSYVLEQNISATAPATTAGRNRERWAYTNNLQLTRDVGISNFIATNYFNKYRTWLVRNFAAPGGNERISRFLGTNYYSFFPTPVVTSAGVAEFTMPPINPANNDYIGTVIDYRIVDEQFGSYVDVNGIEWGWARATNWP